MHTLVVTASDDEGESVTHEVTLTITNVNDAPVATNDAMTEFLTAAEGATMMWDLYDVGLTTPDAG